MSIIANLPLPTLVWIAAVLHGLIDDTVTYRKALKDDPNARWDWMPFLRRAVLIPLGLGGGVAGMEAM